MPVPDSIIDFVRERTMSYGKVKLVLKHNKYYVESSHPETLQFLLKDEVMRNARVLPKTISSKLSTQALFTTAGAPGKDHRSIGNIKNGGSFDDSFGLGLGTALNEQLSSFNSVIGVDTG